MPALAVVSGIGLAIPFLFPQFYLITWCAFIPLLFISHGASLFRVYLYGLLCGGVLFVSATYWMVVFIMKLKGLGLMVSTILASIYWLYSAQLIALPLCVSLALHRATRIPLAIVFPLCFSVAKAFYPQLFPMGLAESQSDFIVALQGLEWFGANALDWVIVSVNGLLYALLGRWPSSVAYYAYYLLAPTGAVLLWFVFGIYQLRAPLNTPCETCLNAPTTYPKEQAKPLRVGVVQPNRPPSIQRPAPQRGYTYAQPPELLASIELAKKGAQLVVWPEARFTGYFYYPHVAEAFRAFVNSQGSHLLIQDYQPYRDGVQKQSFSTSALLSASGEAQLYHKNKLIPFGETSPGAHSYPWVKRGVKAVFGDFFSDLKPGTEHHSLLFGAQQILPFICYEVLFSDYAATAVKNASQQPTLIVVQSNNAWFGRTHQAEQHFRASILRAVALRLPLVHAMNNGPSGGVSPQGRVLFRSDAFSAGAYLFDIHPAMPGKSFYSQQPNLFNNTMLSLLVLLLVIAGWKQRGRLLKSRLNLLR